MMVAIPCLHVAGLYRSIQTRLAEHQTLQSFSTSPARTPLRLANPRTSFVSAELQN
ncbi:hypothetical protein M758_8G171900 [Ceratodon purpureus]|nr:hypothetical protein M758_8G171900 [Ceratodon purpureus]